MKGFLIVWVLFLVSIESSYGFGSRRSGDVPPPSSSLPPPPNADLGTGGLKIVIQKANRFNAEQLEHLEYSRSMLEKAVNSEEFKQRVLHFTYQGQEAFVQNNGLTNLQVYNSLMAGAEMLPQVTSANNMMDLFLELYTSSWTGRNVIGYTTPSTSVIYMNTYFYNDATPAETAANMIHEWTHKLGFDHDYRSTSRRPYSVPYAIGNIVEDLLSKY